MIKEKMNLYILSIVGIVAVVGIVILVLNAGREESTQVTSETAEEIELSDSLTQKEGLNFFVLSPQEGIITGAYIEGEYRVDFEAVRTDMLMELSYMLETGQIYQINVCYIAKNGQSFIVSDGCSVEISPEQEIEVQDETERAKEFQLAKKVAEELSTISLPNGLKHEKELLIDSALSIPT